MFYLMTWVNCLNFDDNYSDNCSIVFSHIHTVYMTYLKTFQSVPNLRNWGRVMSESISGGLAAGVFMKVAVGLVVVGSGLETGGVGCARQRMALISSVTYTLCTWHIQSHTHCIHDLFRHIHSVYVTYLIIK